MATLNLTYTHTHLLSVFGEDTDAAAPLRPLTVVAPPSGRPTLDAVVTLVDTVTPEAAVTLADVPLGTSFGSTFLSGPGGGMAACSMKRYVLVARSTSQPLSANSSRKHHAQLHVRLRRNSICIQILVYSSPFPVFDSLIRRYTCINKYRIATKSVLGDLLLSELTVTTTTYNHQAAPQISYITYYATK